MCLAFYTINKFDKFVQSRSSYSECTDFDFCDNNIFVDTKSISIRK